MASNLPEVRIRCSETQQVSACIPSIATAAGADDTLWFQFGLDSARSTGGLNLRFAGVCVLWAAVKVPNACGQKRTPCI